MPSRADAAKLTAACRNCRERKIKCSGGSPCNDCNRHGRSCFYPPLQRRKRTKDAPVTEAVEDRLSRMEAVLQLINVAELEQGFRSPPQQRGQGTEPLTPSITSSGSGEEQRQHRLSSVPISVKSPTTSRNAEIPARNLEAAPSSSNVPSRFGSLQSPPSLPLSSLGRASSAPYPIPSASQTRKSKGPEEALLDIAHEGEEGASPTRQVNWEHHGPWSWVSVCSQSGLRWVCEKTGTNTFIGCANSLTNGWSQRLAVRRAQTTSSKAPEVDEATAWRYVAAYFDHCYDSVLGVLNRPAFESRLRAHFQSGSLLREDPSWFALRNVVYAAGYRYILSKDSSVSFITAQAQAWQYFKNALSVFTEILFSHSGVTAVQALALMTSYVEALGSPALEYYLCSNAVYMAQAKGLHRQPARSSGVHEDDLVKRSWLWWAVYCLEKQITFRSGRPSAIDDDNISTQIPTRVPMGSTIDVEAFTLIIKHAQICSQISRRIMSVKAFQKSPGELAQTVTEIHEQLQDFLHAMPPELRMVTPTSQLQDLKATSRLLPMMYLHLAVYGSIMAAHILFFYPWITCRFDTEAGSDLGQQVTFSSNTVADAARNIILAVRLITTDVATPAWLAFYYPMYAHINLFIYILKYPTQLTASADLGLLDICAGHFGHIEFMTSSEISFSLPRETVNLASQTVRAARQKENESGTRPIVRQAENTSHDYTQLISNDAAWGGTDCGVPIQLPGASNEMGDFGIMDFDMESLDIFPSFSLTGESTAYFGGFAS